MANGVHMWVTALCVKGGTCALGGQDPRHFVSHLENGRDHVHVQKMVCEQTNFDSVLSNALTTVMYHRVVVIGCRSGRHRSPTVAMSVAHWIDNMLGRVHVVHMGLMQKDEWLPALQLMLTELQRFPEADVIDDEMVEGWKPVDVCNVFPFTILEYKGHALNNVMAVWEEHFLKIIPSQIHTWFEESKKVKHMTVTPPPWRLPVPPASDDVEMDPHKIPSPRTPTPMNVRTCAAAASSSSSAGTSSEGWPAEVEEILSENQIDTGTRRSLLLLKSTGDAGLAHAIRIIFNLNRKKYHLGNPSAFVSRCVENVFLHDFESLHK
jgi:hypothetical protein